MDRQTKMQGMLDSTNISNGLSEGVINGMMSFNELPFYKLQSLID